MSFESNTKLMQSIIQSTEGALNNFVPDSKRIAESDLYFEFSWKMLFSTSDSDARIMWATSLISSAQTEKNLSKLVDLMDNGTKIGNFELDQAMRWNLVQKMAAFGMENYGKRIEEEEKRDPSDRGNRAATTARAAEPSAENKEKTYNRIRTDKESSFHILRSAMAGFRWWHQRDLLKPFDDKFFEEVRSIFKDQNKEYSGAFFAIMFPFYPENEELIKRTSALLESLTPEEKVLKRKLREELDDLARCRKTREFDLK